MWLLPAFSLIGRIAMRTYFRLRVEGPAVPPRGPLLLVANHPNSLLDPALVAAVARRPVRFLAKSTLFPVPVIGWLVRGAGAIPVYRRQDDPALMDRNSDAFSAAFDALAGGAAIGIFPEGVSHDEPSLAPLRTGAARIALETASRLGSDFPIVPVGLVFRDKGTFRSEAQVVVREPVEWRDLAGAPADAEAVRELTSRIERALRRVTVNLESWEDAPFVEAAYAIYAAEFGPDETGTAQLARIRAGTRTLAELRRSGDDRWKEIAREVMRHDAVLRRLGLQPGDLHTAPDYTTALLRAGRLIPFLSLLALAGGLIGSVLFWPPYRLIALTERVLKPAPYVRSTVKVLAGIAFFGLWIGLIAAGAGLVSGWAAAALAAGILPLIALATLRLHERWVETRQEVHRFLLTRTRQERLSGLRARQRRIALAIAMLADRERLVVSIDSPGRLEPSAPAGAPRG
jgi:glycerol-3-phosphate O-acyltransferase / dihydroxyacetone phosphate acyltransferase